jgi:type IV pilus assembly protein PilE
MKVHAPVPRERGFTLVELMAVVVVLAILSAIAIPNYSAYVLRGKRAAAKAVLVDTASRLERQYTTNGCYDRSSVSNCAGATGTVTSVDVAAPPEGRASYRITLLNVASQSFTLMATPCGVTGAGCASGSDASFTDTECGALTLTSTGARGIGGNSTTATGTVATCWQR